MQSLGRRLDILMQINPGAVPKQFLVAQENPDGTVTPTFVKKITRQSGAKTVAVLAGVGIAAFVAAKLIDKRFS